MRFGLVGGSYTDVTPALADEETINWYQSTVESQGAVAPAKAYGGSIAQQTKGLVNTPGLEVFASFSSQVKAQKEINGRLFVVYDTTFAEVLSDGTTTHIHTVVADDTPVSMAASTNQLIIISGGHTYCYDINIDFLAEVSGDIVGTPGRVRYVDGYFVVNILGTNKFQFSDILDGGTWPGINVNAVSVFPENIVSIEVNHRELWIFGAQHAQPYQDTGSDNVFDVIPGVMLETGSANLNSPCLLDNSVFWIGKDDRGARVALRAQGYTPTRISTHAVELDLQTYSEDQIAQMQTYSYQEAGHLFWVIYVPGSSLSWVYDVNEQQWHHRGYWKGTDGPYEAHHTWNHTYCFGKHLVGDWSSGNLYEMHLPINHNDGSYSFVTDNGNKIRRYRRAPTISNEKKWLFFSELTIYVATGLGPQPPLLDGSGNPRQPQMMLRWSDDSGFTWSNEHWKDCGFAGQYGNRVFWLRLGRSRNRVFEVVCNDPVPWNITDGYVEMTSE